MRTGFSTGRSGGCGKCSVSLQLSGNPASGTDDTGELQEIVIGSTRLMIVLRILLRFSGVRSFTLFVALKYEH